MANKAGYTKWYFQRLFKKVTGVTLASYIRARRFDERRLLS
ncbi:helix-turn-helix domain-containing protein [Shigella flexneri]